MRRPTARIAIVGAVALAGCATQATTTPTTTVQVTSSAPATTPRAEHKANHAKPTPVSQPVPSGRRLISTASNDTVQPQPAPGSCRMRGSALYPLPDPRCTPGAISQSVTQNTIDQTICVTGWTDTVRPSADITEQEKSASMAAYGVTGSMGDYEYDHLIPLELGGATNDPKNLWPEPGGVPNPKDSVENALRREVCAGTMPLATAQHIIATGWVGWYRANESSSTSTTTPAPSPTPAATTTTPAPEPSPSSGTEVVHPGAWCAPVGATGVTDRGTAMVCSSKNGDPARWRHG